MSAMIGTGARATIVSSATASLSRGTATRTSSQPASTIASICSSVASTSLVSVLVIDCTTTGAPPPTGTRPTQIWRFDGIAAMLTAACAGPAASPFQDGILVSMSSVRVERDDGVAIVVVDRPPANALDRELLAELVEVGTSLRESDVAAVVLTGRKGFFSAGLDLKAVPTM